jgi:hypothetical protein
MSQRPHAASIGSIPGRSAAELPPPHVVEFIRFCHHRRKVGWPELYDEMCAVAGRREFNGWDHDQFAAHGLTFSLFDMPRLADWVRTVLASQSEAAEPLATASQSV